MNQDEEFPCIGREASRINVGRSFRGNFADISAITEIIDPLGTVKAEDRRTRA